MNKNSDNLLGKLFEIEPPKGLKGAILARLEKERQKAVFRQKMFFQVGFALCGIGSLIALAVFGKAILVSQFASLLALGFSDLEIVLTVWQDYAFSLLETLPIFSMLAVVAPMFVLLLLLKQYAKFKEGSFKYAYRHW